MSLLLVRDEAGVQLSIADDGVGFDLTSARQPAPPARGAGLLGMEDRVTTVGGRFQLSSHVGQGTRIEIEIPL